VLETEGLGGMVACGEEGHAARASDARAAQA